MKDALGFVLGLVIIVAVGAGLAWYLNGGGSVQNNAESAITAAKSADVEDKNAAVREARKKLETALQALKRDPSYLEAVREATNVLNNCVYEFQHPQPGPRSEAPNEVDTNFAFERAAYLVHTDAYWMEVDRVWVNEGSPYLGQWHPVVNPADPQAIVELKGVFPGSYHVDQQFGPFMSCGDLLSKIREIDPGFQATPELIETWARKFGRRVIQ